VNDLDMKDREMQVFLWYFTSRRPRLELRLAFARCSYSYSYSYSSLTIFMHLHPRSSIANCLVPCDTAQRGGVNSQGTGWK